MPTNEFLRSHNLKRKTQRDGVCESSKDFITRVKRDSKRVSILMEGDSWFDYPPKYLLWGKQSNISEWLKSYLGGKNAKANIISFAKNGDTADNMTGSPGADEVRELIKKAGHRLDFLLVSAGGNDFTGEVLLDYLNEYQDGFSAEDCINSNFDETLKSIRNRYLDVFSFLNVHAKNAKILTHSYCYLKPEERGFKAIFIRVGKGWVCQYLNDENKNIPHELHEDIIKIMLDRFHTMLCTLQEEYANFHIVDFRENVLRPGNYNDWADEMHPTSAGFRKLAHCFLEKMRSLDPRVPKLPF